MVRYGAKGRGLTQPTPNRIREPASPALAPEACGKQSDSNPGPLGLFGGRFDPVHRAHLRVAQAVADQLGLNEVRWIVTGDPVHKSAVASAQDRLSMVKLALGELADPRMQADDREIISAEKTGNPSYTADTVAAIQAEQPGRRLIWILGEDQLQDFQTWSRWEWLVKNAELAVCARPQARSGETARRIQAAGGVIHWVSIEPDSVSSTQIRTFVRSKQQLTVLIPRSVADYIDQHLLYQ